MNLQTSDFDPFHRAIHGHPPFAWQTRLLEQIVGQRSWPSMLDLPTGSGKTTCIDIALFALALDQANEARYRWCPRRIAMVVDRRIVVDQVAERGRKLLNALTDSEAAPVVGEVARRLRSLSAQAEEPVGVFTLRGGMPKDDAWARTPDQPLILASTVDQLGSRLLIQGYGVSRGMKPVHAGLLGNDLLLLLDEVHLSQPFAETLNSLAHLRRRFEKESLLPARFCHAFLSATPGASEVRRFELADTEKGADSALGQRLHASKKVRLRDVSDRQSLEKACVDEACESITRHKVVAVVVNRVASASIVVQQLRERLRASARIALLTGRMRPLDRDDVLRELRPLIMTGRDRAIVEEPLIVVGTQCIEAGADFDFDALITEAAAFDSIRQRFGRVDRLGKYGRAEGVIVYPKSAEPDPIYGEAIPETVAWFREHLDKKTKQVDLGVLAFPIPEENQLQTMMAPKQAAPVLLPAYLDLWMQTSPAPVSVPDVALWLHGPQSSPADVQVVWRMDVTEKDFALPDAEERITRIVAAVRPSSLEAISVPFAAARRWLLGERAGDIADVEGASDEREGEPRKSLRALRWSGDDSKVISARPQADGPQLRPGDTIIVPAERGGIRDSSFDPAAFEAVADLAERAALFGRGQPVLRLRPDVMKHLGLAAAAGDLEEVGETRSGLAAVGDAETGWRKLWLMRLAKSRTSIVVEVKDPWQVLQGKRVGPEDLRKALGTSDDDTVEDGIELSTDEDDSYQAGRSVPLSRHSSDVEQFARRYARNLGLSDELVRDLALAGWLHDIGKADRRFQLMLREGSEVAYYKDETPWAKSAMLPGAKSAQRAARQKSFYPAGARHEVQSVAMLEQHLDAVKQRAHDLDLVLHLVASHHGHCRPFAPTVPDRVPVSVELGDHTSDAFDTIHFGAVSSDNQLHRLDGGLADRFWRLVAKYGWQELCWLEGILRLADHRASESEQTGDES